MRRVSLLREQVCEGSLILVNKDHPLLETAHENRLESIGRHHNVLLQKEAAAALEKLLEDIHCGEQIVPVSGYRSPEEQNQIYQASLLENGATFTKKYVMPLNCSEHQSGLAVDLALNRPDIDFLRPYFPYTGICGAFRSRMAAFGFIERYPEGKEGLTGIAHEPWHFRYVGAPHSKLIEDRGLTLEEYLLWLKACSCGVPLHYSFIGSDFEISYIAANGEAFFESDCDLAYTVSGDNVDGFIVNKWRESK